MFDLSPPIDAPSGPDPTLRRAALALAEAILPGSATVQPADERTLARTEEVVARISPWASRLFYGFVAVLDRAAVLHTGRRFHALDGAAQQRLLERFERDPVLRTPLGTLAFALKFVHFDRVDVYESLGGRLNVVSGDEAPRYLSQVVEATAWDADEEIECEVVVVGTGAGGAVVGKELADRGFAVAFVEEGKLHRRSSFTGSSIQAHFDFYRGSLTLGNAVMPIFMGRLVGGSTAINTGSCFRTPPWILDRWCEDIGTDELGPDAMRPHFERVERQLEVEEANAAAVGPIADVIARGCDALGWSHRRMMRNAPGCMGEGFCDFGCRTDARKSTNLSYIPPALEKGSMLFTGLRATRVRLEGGRAVGVEGVDANGRTLRVRADAVVLAGGALPTPVMLLQQGIANSSGQVGRNLSVHPSGGFAGLVDERLEPHKHIPQGYYVDEHLRDGILINAAQPDVNFSAIFFPETGHRLMEHLAHAENMAFFGVLIADHAASGVVRPGPGGLPLARYSLAREDVDRMHDAFVRTGEMLWAAGAKRVYMATQSWRSARDLAEWKRFKAARLSASDLMLTSYHPLGTCRMGRDPKTSVVGLDHESHDVKRLFVVDGSTVPGPLGVNPQVTIMAMATRAAARIADKLS